ncbi:MAG: amylo-alpha-1,6-glucosidase [Methylacidiphilales bacterium]|nr:amylo-alpha-1,6-glucosidase [Candidatus Methylacidiphilales bacterium]
MTVTKGLMSGAEWLEADGLGGFASGTAEGIRTRRYHAALLVATAPPSGRMVLVNGFDAEIETAAGRLALSTQRYAPGVNAPDGTTRLENFSPEPWPQWIYAVPGGKILQELFVPHETTSVVLRWRWEPDEGGARNGKETSGAGPLKLDVRPFFSGRDFHATHHENGAFRFEPESVPEGERWHFYDGVPAVLVRRNGTYHHEPVWYRNFLYDEELARGLDAVEDLAAPGRYAFDLAAGPATLIFSAPDLGLDSFAGSATELAESLAKKETARRSAFSSPRLRAAKDYLVRRGAGRTIIAGYPWFGDWGRDTFIALRGLCLATGRLREARDILTAWAGTVSQGMLPNRFPDHGEPPEYNSVDASLWYVIAVHEFLAAAKAEPKLETQTPALMAATRAILCGYLRGTRYGIRCDADRLLACGEPGVQLTWMDAKVDDRVITPRIGKPVEVQALWLNALALSAREDHQWRAIFTQGCQSFRERFWNEARSCLYDVVDVDHQPGKVDDRLRPNQIFAAGGLPVQLLDPDKEAQVVQTVEEKLWTPLGLRSLAPGEPGYCPRYEGGPLERNEAYHQGTVWPWLAGPFVEAWLRVHGSTPEKKAEARQKFLLPQLLRFDLPGLGHVPEIADAEPPHTARGCPFQAWSLGEIVRLEKILGDERPMMSTLGKENEET